MENLGDGQQENENPSTANTMQHVPSIFDNFTEGSNSTSVQ